MTGGIGRNGDRYERGVGKDDNLVVALELPLKEDLANDDIRSTCLRWPSGFDSGVWVCVVDRLVRRCRIGLGVWRSRLELEG